MEYQSVVKKGRMKIVMATTLVASSLLVVGAGAASASSRTGHASGTKLSSILFVNPLPKYQQWAEIASCLATQAKTLGIPESETGPSASSASPATTMIQEIQQGIADKSGAIITFPESNGFAPVLEQAKKAGIVTGTMYGGSGAPSGEFNAGSNWTLLGEQYVATIAERKGLQNVALLSQSPTGVGAAFDNGFKAAAAKTSNVKVVAEGYTNDDPATAQQQAEDLLTAHPNINVFASNMGTATTPVVSVVKAKGLVGKVVMVANGASGGGTVGAQEHVVYRFLMQNLCALGKESVTLAEDIATGAPHPSFWPVPTILASLSNYKKLQSEGWD